MFGLRRRVAEGERISSGAIRGLQVYIDSLALRLKRLECPHENVRFMWNTWVLITGMEQAPGGKKVCQACGKVLATYATKEALLTAKLAYQRDLYTTKVHEVEQELREQQRQDKGDDT